MYGKEFTMKTHLIFVLLLIAVPCIAAGQNAADSTARRHVGITVLDSRSKPVQGLFMYTSISGDKGFYSDRKGHAVARGISDSDTLWVVRPGLETIVIPLAGQDSLRIKLKSDNRYRVVNFRSEGNITLANGIEDVQEVLKTRTCTCLADLLIGMIPGLNVYYTPDGGVSSNMRGPNSITQSTEPIVYIDGVESGTLSEVNSFMNVRDIKSIYVDKDGSMYGAKGGCGIIKIQTIGGSMSTY